MHIIVFAHRLATPKSVTLTARHAAVAGALLAASVVVIAAAIYFVTFRYAVEIKLPVLQDLVGQFKAGERDRKSTRLNSSHRP